MKIKNTKRNYKKTVAITVALLVITVGATYALTRDQNKIITEQNDKTSSIKENQVNEKSDQVNATSSEKTKLPPKNQPGESNNDTMPKQRSNVATPSTPPEKPLISRADQKTSTIKVVAILQSSSPGYCELKLSKASQSIISREANISIGPSYYSCTFTLPVSSLESKGDWQVVVIHHIGKASTASDKSLLEIR